MIPRFVVAPLLACGAHGLAVAASNTAHPARDTAREDAPPLPVVMHSHGEDASVQIGLPNTMRALQWLETLQTDMEGQNFTRLDGSSFAYVSDQDTDFLDRNLLNIERCSLNVSASFLRWSPFDVHAHATCTLDNVTSVHYLLLWHVPVDSGGFDLYYDGATADHGAVLDRKAECDFHLRDGSAPVRVAEVKAISASLVCTRERGRTDWGEFEYQYPAIAGIVNLFNAATRVVVPALLVWSVAAAARDIQRLNEQAPDEGEVELQRIAAA